MMHNPLNLIENNQHVLSMSRVEAPPLVLERTGSSTVMIAV